jgi:hypothetical protein
MTSWRAAAILTGVLTLAALARDAFYAYDPTKDAWTELRTEVMPFAMKGSSFDVVTTPLADHGVTLFITAERKGLKVCLYKHSAPGK